MVIEPSKVLDLSRSQTLSAFTAERGGFLSTLASYLTSGPKKSSPKKVIQKKKLINRWDDVDLTNLNAVVCNFMYTESKYQNLFLEIERLIGRSREHCFYGIISAILCLVLLNDPIGAICGIFTLCIPAFFTIMTLTNREDPPVVREDQQTFLMRYWFVYSMFVIFESCLSSLIRWDLRLFRLAFMSMCFSTRIPILGLVYQKLETNFENGRLKFEENNYQMIEVVPAISDK